MSYYLIESVPILLNPLVISLNAASPIRLTACR
jgi:hypothetical protein